MARLFTVACLLAGVAVPSAFAQSSPEILAGDVQSKGLHEHRSYFSPEPFEHFDPMTGNLVLTFTDLVLPGNAGRSLRFQRTYNNQRNAIAGPSRWSFGFPGIPMRVVERPIPPGFMVGVTELTYLDEVGVSTPSLVMADGGWRSTFYMNEVIASPSPETALVTSGDLYRYNRATRVLQMPDGTVCYYDQATGRLISFHDSFSNLVELEWGAESLLVRQHLGVGQTREVLLTLDASSRVTRLNYLGREWQYTYGFDGPNGTKDITEVVSPVGSRWLFAYYTGATNTTSTPAFYEGEGLTGIDTSHGGHIEYEYAEYEMAHPTGGTFGIPPLVRNIRYRRSSGVGVEAGEWVLTHGPSIYGETYSKASAIVTPSGRRVLYTHDLLYAPGPMALGSIGLKTREIFATAAATSPVERLTLAHTALPLAFSDFTLFVPRVEDRVITRFEATGSRAFTSHTTYRSTNYADFHHPWTVTESSNGLSRTTTLTYQTPGPAGPFVTGLPVEERVQVGSETFIRTGSYDANGFRLSSSDYRGLADAAHTTFYVPDGLGNVATITDPNENETSLTYSFGQVQATVTPEYTVTRTINPDGTVASELKGGRVSSFGYDALSRVTLAQPPGGTLPAVTTYVDSPLGSSVETSRGDSRVTTKFDGFGRTIETVNGLGIMTRTSYDAEGRVTRSGLPFLPPTFPDKGVTIAYDALDRLVSQTHAGGASSTIAYGPGVVTISENDVVTQQNWAAFGSPADARLDGVVDGKGGAWVYGYNALGSLTSVLAPDTLSRTWTYNSRNQLVSETHPESGVTTYQYDPAGRLTQKADAKATVFTYTYDGNNRLKQQSASAGGEVLNVTYESGTDNRRSAVLGGVSSLWSYDASGRPATREDFVDGMKFLSSFQYDNRDRVIEIGYPHVGATTDRRRVGYEYDAEGRITRVFNALDQQNYANGFTYHPSGAATGYTAGNGVATTFAYDADRYWRQSINVAGVWSLQYQNYDAVGNVGALVDSRAGKNQEFAYDELDRLVEAVGPYGSIVYAYDAHGNRTPANGMNYTYEPGTLRLASQQPAGLPAETFTYDNNGNLLTGAAKTFTYTLRNMLATSNVSSATGTYRYDADLWRIKQTTGTTPAYNLRGLAGELLTEWTSPGPSGVTRDYVYAGSRLIASLRKPTTAVSPVYDYIIPDGPAVTVTLGAANMEGYLVFDGLAGQRMSLYGSNSTMTNVTGCNVWVTVWNPDAMKLSPTPDTCFDGTGWTSPHAGFIDPMLLPVTGTYLIKIDPNLTASGSLTLNLYTVPPDVAVPITPGGPDVGVSIVKPGQNGYLSFTGAPGQRVAVLANPVAMDGHMWSQCDTDVSILRPDNELAHPANAGACIGAGLGAVPFLDTVTLTEAGPHRVFVNPKTKALGTATFRLYAVPADLTGAITPGGPAVPVPLAVGQNASYTFTGVVGQRVSLAATGGFSGHVGFGCDAWATIRRPNGSAVPNGALCVENNGFLEPVTLADTGTFKVEVNPDTAASGSVTLSLYTVAADGTGTLTVNGSSVPVSLTTPGQNAVLSFSGTGGQSVTVRVTGNGIASVNVRLMSGTTTLKQATSSAAAFNLAPHTLPSTGTYTVKIDPPYANTGGLSVQVTNP